MKHFYAGIGSRAYQTESHAVAKESDLWAHVRGWEIGGLVELEHNKAEGVDYVKIYLTLGNSCQKQSLIWQGSEAEARKLVESGKNLLDFSAQLFNSPGPAMAERTAHIQGKLI